MSLLEPPQDLLAILHKSLPSHRQDENEEIITYVSFLAAGLADAQEFDTAVWSSTLEPYFQMWQDSGVACTMDHQWLDVIERFREATQKVVMGDDDAESYGGEDEGEEEVCNLRFNLAYGGKILLHQTKLRLLRGRRYALMGKNGTGKTTLMNAINNGKLEGWPVHLKTAYVESGSNVDPEFVAQNVLQHLLDSTGRSKEDCVTLLKDQLQFTDKMIQGTIGELSGGWQMKLRLAKAVLLDPDIYCLDEPTNHLSHEAVAWLTDFVVNLRDRTVLCVSHDTQFLENICTDVIHYEQRDIWGPYRKLVHYKGKMSDFVKRIPEAKHYFALATTDLKFTFPEPGRLEGVRTSTQKIIELENVDYAYPGTDYNTLTDVNLKMSLSSRVVVLGANGAGST
jgi:elongation factor 3